MFSGKEVWHDSGSNNKLGRFLHFLFPPYFLLIISLSFQFQNHRTRQRREQAKVEADGASDRDTGPSDSGADWQTVVSPNWEAESTDD